MSVNIVLKTYKKRNSLMKKIRISLIFILIILILSFSLINIIK